jgi:adenosylmethionine-8-amino-7-oxononanoate aminotransferase
MFIDIVRTRPVKGQEQESYDACNLLKKQQLCDLFMSLWFKVPGMVMYEPESLDKLMQICKENGVLTIADEVMTALKKPEKYLRQIIW